MQNGSISLGALITVLVISVISARIVALCFQINDLKRETFAAKRARAMLAGRIFNQTHSHNSGPLQCSTVADNAYGGRRSLMLCELVNQASNEELKRQIITRSPATPFPRLHIEPIFLNRTACPTLVRPAELAHWPDAGHSMGSIVSPQSCLPHSHISASYLSLHENLIMSDPLNIKGLNAVSTIAALGYMSLAQTTVENDALLIAGGDLKIQSLYTENTARATLISMTGRVSVDEIYGPVQLKVLSLIEPTIPAAAAQAEALLPGISQSLILSLARN